MRLETKCVHAGGWFDQKTRGINTPIYTSTAYEYLDSSEQPYARDFNTPNQASVVRKLCELEQAEDGVVFSSGMAAISATLQALLKVGDHAVIQDDIYGGAHAYVTERFPTQGIEYTLAGTTADSMEASIRPTTRLVYVETPTNPLLKIVDIRRVVEVARTHGILTVIDNTFASPVNQNPIALGIDVVVHSGTKYLGGHSDLSCGAAVSSRALAGRIRTTALGLGGNLNASTCYLMERSLKTLHLRVERQTQNAQAIAEFLARHPRVRSVHYPGLASHPGHEVARRQMRGFGAMLSFEVEPTAACAMLRRLVLIRPALSLGGVESTICEPARTSHRKVSAEVRERMGISAGLLRLSVGIEHAEDLIADLEGALSG